ncbi:MAG: DinB family protein [Gemmatimonadaceae bacterium]|nr:DinB family protein [Gemmatimonadaceae bacterium]
MYSSPSEFARDWHFESQGTQKVLDRLTDASLAQEVYPGGRSIGRLAWHIAQTIPEMMSRTGLRISGVGEHEPVPSSAAAIAKGYHAASASLLEQIAAHWTNATLTESDDMYGEQWTRAETLSALLRHQTHHRGQLTVLMRQAGLTVPGIYGPTKEDWAQMGMEPPPV